MQRDTSHLLVEFFMEPRENKRKSAEAGRPIFDDVEFVKIRTAGDPKTVFIAPAHSPSTVRDLNNRPLTYAQAHKGPYEAFREGVEYVGAGTPLKEAPFLSASKAKELAALNIMTVEALAELEGEKLGRIGMEGRPLKEAAIALLKKAQGNVDISRLEAENEALTARLEALEKNINAAPASQAPETAGDPTVEEGEATPFDDWDAETIRAWMTEQGGIVNSNWNLKHLRKKANELNASLASEAA